MKNPKKFYQEFETNLKAARPTKKRELDIAILNFVKKHTTGTLLDIGCGFGELLKNLNQYDYKTVGMEISKWSVEGCKQNKVNIIQSDASYLFPFKNNCFDSVISIDSIEHLFNWQLCLDEIHRVLKPNGRLLLFTPNKDIWHSTQKYKDRHRIHESITEPHIHEFTSQEICTELRSRGFGNIKLHIKKLYYPFYNIFQFIEDELPKNNLPYILLTSYKSIIPNHI